MFDSKSWYYSTPLLFILPICITTTGQGLINQDLYDGSATGWIIIYVLILSFLFLVRLCPYIPYSIRTVKTLDFGQYTKQHVRNINDIDNDSKHNNYITDERFKFYIRRLRYIYMILLILFFAIFALHYEYIYFMTIYQDFFCISFYLEYFHKINILLHNMSANDIHHNNSNKTKDKSKNTLKESLLDSDNNMESPKSAKIQEKKNGNPEEDEENGQDVPNLKENIKDNKWNVNEINSKIDKQLYELQKQFNIFQIITILCGMVAFYDTMLLGTTLGEWGYQVKLLFSCIMQYGSICIVSFERLIEASLKENLNEYVTQTINDDELRHPHNPLQSNPLQSNKNINDVNSISNDDNDSSENNSETETAVDLKVNVNANQPSQDNGSNNVDDSKLKDNDNNNSSGILVMSDSDMDEPSFLCLSCFSDIIFMFEEINDKFYQRYSWQIGLWIIICASFYSLIESFVNENDDFEESTGIRMELTLVYYYTIYIEMCIFAIFAASTTLFKSLCCNHVTLDLDVTIPIETWYCFVCKCCYTCGCDEYCKLNNKFWLQCLKEPQNTTGTETTKIVKNNKKEKEKEASEEKEEKEEKEKEKEEEDVGYCLRCFCYCVPLHYFSAKDDNKRLITLLNVILLITQLEIWYYSKEYDIGTLSWQLIYVATFLGYYILSFGWNYKNKNEIHKKLSLMGIKSAKQFIIIIYTLQVVILLVNFWFFLVSLDDNYLVYYPLVHRLWLFPLYLLHNEMSQFTSFIDYSILMNDYMSLNNTNDTITRMKEYMKKTQNIKKKKTILVFFENIKMLFTLLVVFCFYSFISQIFCLDNADELFYHETSWSTFLSFFVPIFLFGVSTYFLHLYRSVS